MSTDRDDRGELRQAMELHQRGEIDAARQLYARHLETCPDDAAALCLLGALEGGAGNHPGAEDAYRRALDADPDHAAAYAGLGTSFLLQDRPAEATEALASAIDLAPDLPEPRLQYALALQRCARLPEARQALAEFVARWPDHLESRHNLGLLMLQTDSPDEAVAEFRLVLERDPSRVSSWIGLGRALLAANDPASAEAALGRARDLSPGDPAPMVLLGMLMQQKGRVGEARAAFESALKSAPGHAPAAAGLAELDLAEGEPQRGLERLAALASENGAPPVSRSILVRLLIAAGRPEEALGHIDGWLAEGDAPPRARAAMLIDRGRILDGIGRHDEAWESWSRARRQAPPRVPAGHFSYAVDRLVHAYQAEVFQRLRPPATQAGGCQPLLIVGSPRSGKSCLEQILSCHPSIRGAGELRVLGRLSNEIARRYGSAVRPYPDCIAALGADDVRELREAYRQALGGSAGTVSWVTDTQPTNFLHIGLAAILEPALRVVWCRRDPLDTAWACLSRKFADPGLDFVATPSGIDTFLRGLERLMGHWGSAIPLEILEVGYEGLVTSTRPTVERVLDYLGLEWDASLADYTRPGLPHLDAAPVLTEPLNDAEIGRGRPYAERLGMGLAAGESHGD